MTRLLTLDNMASCKTVCILLALLSCLSCYESASLTQYDDVRPQGEDEDNQLQLQKWLDDFDTVPRQDDEAVNDVMQADSPVGDDGIPVRTAKNFLVNRKVNLRTQSVDDDQDDDAPRCPPPILPVSMIRSWCAAIGSASASNMCQTDTDCQLSKSSNQRRKCCHDGCRRICTVPIAPAPYIDWKREPQTRLTSGKSWLIQGPEESHEVEWCSTSYVYDDVTSDEEPLLCPSGYVCFIDDPGDIENGVPNRGRCVPESARSTSDKASNFRLAASPVSINGSCAVLNVTYNKGDTFSYEKHTCKCEDGEVMCQVGKKTPLDSAIKRRV